MSKKLTLKIEKYQTVKQAEWRMFCDAMNDDKYDPKAVLALMTDKDNIAGAKRWLNGPTKAQEKASKARQNYINHSPEVKREIKFMQSDKGFFTNNPLD